MSETGKEISIIIVTYNSLPALESSLISIQNSHTIAECEIIVVDNNSTDGSIALVLSIFPSANITENKENLGFAHACNIGAQQAHGDYLLFYNPDLEIDKDAFANMLQFCRTNKQAGAVSGRMRFPDGTFQATCRKFPDKINIFLSRGSALSKIIKTEKSYTLPDYDSVTEVDAVAGTLLMIKRAVFEEIGCFDRRFFMYMEDSDLSYRLHAAGYKNYFLPTAGGVHLWGKGSEAGQSRRSYYHHVSVWKYFFKHFPSVFSIFFLPLLLLGNFILGVLLPKR